MKTLKEALANAGITPEQVASIESNGYCIAPMEATAKIAKAMKRCEDGSRTVAEGYREIVAARPKIED